MEQGEIVIYKALDSTEFQIEVRVDEVPSTLDHIGASLKDLGKKWFAFSKIALNASEMMAQLTK